jgi:hypothetical protein
MPRKRISPRRCSAYTQTTLMLLPELILPADRHPQPLAQRIAGLPPAERAHVLELLAENAVPGHVKGRPTR